MAKVTIFLNLHHQGGTLELRRDCQMKNPPMPGVFIENLYGSPIRGRVTNVDYDINAKRYYVKAQVSLAELSRRKSIQLAEGEEWKSMQDDDDEMRAVPDYYSQDQQ